MATLNIMVDGTDGNRYLLGKHAYDALHQTSWTNLHNKKKTRKCIMTKKIVFWIRPTGRLVTSQSSTKPPTAHAPTFFSIFGRIIMLPTLSINDFVWKYCFNFRFKVYNVKLQNETQQSDLYKLKSDIIDFWRKPCVKYNVVGKVMVPPSHADWFEDRLAEIGVETDVFVEDVYE